ncbi:hypothetical protein K456DRAFT_1170628 [Colletotrichum gloeosporioides 23]|nr:hypothetical protein K456DRAFT_1170628 [Colletotrichum gloeosporioides 23]
MREPDSPTHPDVLPVAGNETFLQNKNSSRRYRHTGGSRSLLLLMPLPIQRVRLATLTATHCTQREGSTPILDRGLDVSAASLLYWHPSMPMLTMLVLALMPASVGPLWSSIPHYCQPSTALTWTWPGLAAVMTDTCPRDTAAGGVLVLALLHRTRTWTCTRPLGERLCIPLAPFASAVYTFWPALEFRHPNHAERPSTKLFAACLMFVMGAAALSISPQSKLRRDLAVTTAEPTVECRRRRKSGMLGGDGVQLCEFVA